jgi:Ca2+-transporting ATPase
MSPEETCRAFGVEAVDGGRGLYDNLMKYVRVQLVMLGGFILTFLGAAIFDIANGAPLTPLQILWVNLAAQLTVASLAMGGLGSGRRSR